MKSFLFLFFSLFAVVGLKAQENVQTETNLNTQMMTYHKEIPNENSFMVSKNSTGNDIPKAILEDINLHRKLDENFIWVVNDQIEILIYPMNKKEVELNKNKK